MGKPTKLEPCNIKDVWDKIKPCLEEIKVSWSAMSSWRVEDIYAAVIMERAIVYANEDGFAICTIDTDQYNGQTDLFIWIAYAYEGNRGGILKKYLPSFIEVAKDLGCRGVVTVSNHPALAEMKELRPMYTKYRVLIDGEGTT